MPTGTPGFSGSRLREVREVRGLRQNALSEMLSVTPQAVSNYESGNTTPTASVAEKISQVLNVPLNFFFLPARARDPAESQFFRSMSSATKSARARAINRQFWLRDIVVYLSDVVQLPDTNIPDFRVDSNPLMLNDDEIEQLATDTRRFWKMGDAPIGNMVNLLENHGAVVNRDQLGAATLDSLTVRSDRPYVTIGTDKGTSVRWRYDAAHELGHLILHARVDIRALTRPAEFKRIEEQAHRFAGAFLLPLVPFADDLFAATLDTFYGMKSKWRVSIAAMLVRATAAHLISEETSRRLWINLSRRGWRIREPLDDEIPVEHPRVVGQAINLAVTDGVHTADDLRNAVGLFDRDIETLAGLEPGTLKNLESPRLALRSEGATVLRFPERGVL